MINGVAPLQLVGRAEAEERSIRPAQSQTGPQQQVAADASPVTLPPKNASVAQTAPATYVSHEILATDLIPAAIETARRLGFKIDASPLLSNLNGAVIRLTIPKGFDLGQARALLQKALPNETFALNRLYRLYRTASDLEPERTELATLPGRPAVPCKGDRCFGRQAIHWQDTLQACSSGLRIGVIDTGIDHEHPAFTGRRINNGNFVPAGKSRAPNWHGTGVLAVLAGEPKSGTPGLIPNADFFVADVFFADANGEFATDTVSLLKALDWMHAFDVKLINMSFAGPRDELVQKAIERMSASGVLFVAAAGNEGPAAVPSYPAAYKQVIAVTAVNKDLRSYRHANRGDYIDVAAPGVDIWTAVPDRREGYHTGTSFAAPYATAVLASVYRSIARPQKDEVLNRLATLDLGPPGRDPIYGRGLLMAPTDCRLDEPAASTTIASTPRRWLPSVRDDNGLTSFAPTLGFR